MVLAVTAIVIVIVLPPIACYFWDALQKVLSFKPPRRSTQHLRIEAPADEYVQALRDWDARFGKFQERPFDVNDPSTDRLLEEAVAYSQNKKHLVG